MNAGQLNELITITKPFVCDGKFGPQKTAYVPYINNMRAKAQVIGGQRMTQNDEVVYGYNVRFTVRYYQQIKDFMRIQWHDKVYRIISIIPDRERNETVITTEIIND